MSPSPDLPSLDCHAHIAPDVTTSQIAALQGAIIFAMTRSPAEAAVAARRRDQTIIWGYGAHPGLKATATQITAERIDYALNEHLLIGEIGLDRGSALEPQQKAFETILQACTAQPVLLSIHSTGRTGDVLTALARYPQRGAILHWFNGTQQEILTAVEMGCYFSVNAAMTDKRISWIPSDRLLPETDFPSSRRSTKAKLPGDIDYLEQRIAQMTGETSNQIRMRWYKNLNHLVRAAAVDDRLPSTIRNLLDKVR
jgi:TatD DNase family protein